MIKLILTFLLGISLNQSYFKEMFIKTNTICFTENDGIKYLYENTYKLSYKDITIYENDIYEDISFCLFDNNIYILFKDDLEVIIKKYSLSGNYLSEFKIYNCFKEIKIINLKNKLTLYGGINLSILKEERAKENNLLNDNDLDLLIATSEVSSTGIDGFTLSIDLDKISEVMIYEGREDEYFNNIYLYSDQIYYIGKKGINSGGIYGNGGIEESNFVLTIHNNLVENRQIFNDDIINIKTIDNYLVICTKTAIYLFDGLNSLISSRKTAIESLFSIVTNNFTCLCISEDKGYLFDLRDFQILYEFAINGYDYTSYSDYLYLKKEEQGYVLDLVDLNYYYSKVVYRYFNNPDYLEGLYGTYSLNEVRYNPYFNELVYGEYDATYLYQYKSLEIELLSKVVIEEESNICKDMIYPSTYHLLFSGEGYLNGEHIYQNHEVGFNLENNLELRGITDTKNIIFLVDAKQISFQNDLISSYDYVGTTDSLMRIYLNTNEEINSVDINGEEYLVYTEDDKKYIELVIKKGINGYLIKKGTYVCEDISKEVPINYFFKVLGIIDPEVDVSIDVLKDQEKVRVLTSFNKGAEYLRVIVLKIDDQLEDKTYYFPIGSNKISIDSLDNNASFSLYFGIYNGSNNLDLLKIFSGTLSGGELMDTFIISKQENLEELAFDIGYNSGVNSIEFNDYYIELNTQNNNYPLIIYGLISVLLVIAIIFLRRRKKKIK